MISLKKNGFNFNIKNADLFTQIRSLTIYLGTLPTILFICAFLLESSFGDKITYIHNSINNILIFGLILSPFAIYISIKRKEYFGVIAVLPALNLLFALFIPTDTLFLLLVVVIPSFSIGYLIKKHEMHKLTLILAFMITGICFLGIVFWVLFLLQLTAVLFILYAMIYSCYHAIKDNLGLLVNLGRARCYYLFTKAIILWCPLLIVIIPAFYVSYALDQAVLKADQLCGFQKGLILNCLKFHLNTMS